MGNNTYKPGDPYETDYLIYDEETETWNLPVPIDDLWRGGGVPMTPPFRSPTGDIWQIFSKYQTTFSLFGPRLWWISLDDSISFDQYQSKCFINWQGAYQHYINQEPYELPTFEGNPSIIESAPHGYHIQCSYSNTILPNEWEWIIDPAKQYTPYDYGPAPGYGQFIGVFRSLPYHKDSLKFGDKISVRRESVIVIWPPPAVRSTIATSIVGVGLLKFIMMGYTPAMKPNK